jgi:3-hydroxyacyl-[acyl-carrier-protein] dehydratase
VTTAIEGVQSAEAAQATERLDTQRILALLPHRYPFLLVDRIERIVGDLSCVGIKNVTANEPFFQGHFPGRPVMPGVLLLEGMAQTAGAICALTLNGERAPLTVYFLTVDKAKFRRPVLPGDRVEFHMTRLSRRKTMWWYRGEAKVDGALVCEAELGAMIADA